MERDREEQGRSIGTYTCSMLGLGEQHGAKISSTLRNALNKEITVVPDLTHSQRDKAVVDTFRLPKTRYFCEVRCTSNQREPGNNPWRSDRCRPKL